MLNAVATRADPLKLTFSLVFIFIRYYKGKLIQMQPFQPKEFTCSSIDNCSIEMRFKTTFVYFPNVEFVPSDQKMTSIPNRFRLVDFFRQNCLL